MCEVALEVILSGPDADEAGDKGPRVKLTFPRSRPTYETEWARFVCRFTPDQQFGLVHVREGWEQGFVSGFLVGYQVGYQTADLLTRLFDPSILRAMPPRAVTVCRMKAEGATWPEIADLLGLKPEGARYWWKRACEVAGMKPWDLSRALREARRQQRAELGKVGE